MRGAGVIVGHSERRADHGESDDMVAAKAKAAHRAGLTPIVCIGETEAERKEGKTLEVVAARSRVRFRTGARRQHGHRL